MQKGSNKRSGHIISLGFSIAILVIANRLPRWDLAFLLDTYPDALWAINLSQSVQIGVYAILSIHHTPKFYSVGQVLIGAFGIVALAVILRVFPVDFSQVVGSWLNTLFRVVLIVGIVGSAISIIVNAVKALGAVKKSLD